MSVVPSFDLSSDHSPTIITLNDVQLATSPDYLPNKYTNWMKYKKYVSTHVNSNTPLKSGEEIDNAVKIFTSIVNTAVNVATPTKFSKLENNSYNPSTIRKLVSDKRKARREWQKHRSPRFREKLKECEKLLQQALRLNEERNLKIFLNNLDPTERTDYSLWKATKNLRRPIAHESPIRLENGTWARSTEEKVNAFAEHLESVFTPNPGPSTVVQPLIDDIVPNPIRFSLKEIESSIASIKLKKSPGKDRITPNMLKKLPTPAVKLLLFIFNSILRVGYFPSVWKESEIVMIPKPGKDPTQVKSYRPISLLSILSKLFETTLLRKLTPHITNSNIIPDHQFGFRKNHSTIEQVHRIVTNIRMAFERKEYCSALFIDISQAFDRVWHLGILYKICETLPKNTHKLFCSYLSNRTFVVKSKDILSNSRKILAGVPQGNILGPILYVLFTADMPTTNETLTSTFADDTAFISIHKDPLIASEKLQYHVYLLENWLTKWRISVNASKCIHVTFALRRELCPTIKIFNTQVPQKDTVKYLGMHLDRRLTWKQHIDAKITQIKLKKANLEWLIGIRSSIKLEYKVLLYKTIIKPIWTYGIQLWGTASASNVSKLQRRQSNILRSITGAPWYIRNANIHKDLNILTVEEEIKKLCRKYLNKLSEHPNNLARQLLLFGGHDRLRRRDTLSII